MPVCAALLEPKGLELAAVKSTLNAENFVCRLSWSISSHNAVAVLSLAPNRPSAVMVTAVSAQ